MDINAIKNKLNALNKQANKTNYKWRPEDGKQVIRIVPSTETPENPFRELYFYYNLAKRTYISPRSFGRPDPVYDFAESLKATGEKDKWAMGRKLEPKMRTYVPVIVRGKESEGVKLWGFGVTIYKELLSIISDPDYGDITDLVSGRDITVEYTPASGPGTFPETAIRVKPNTSPASEDKKILDLIKNQPSVSEVWKEPTPEELETALQTHLGADSDVSDETGVDESDNEEVAEKSKSVSAASSSNTDDLTKKFDALFEND